MLKNRINSQAGFTLIELIVVVIIVGILASISVSSMANIRKRAILTEAIMGLSAIRTAERLYYVEHGYYSNDVSMFGTLNASVELPNIQKNDLNGTYFSEGVYAVAGRDSQGPDSFTVLCYISAGMSPWNYAPKRKDTLTLLDDPGVTGHLEMDQNGNIKVYGISGSGYPGD